ncbi:MAG: DNA repair protein RecN [Fimbriimonadaceae bacterium]|nr:DNA repair protein RecN [Fimbriimonadaceae bacterium]
MITSLTVEQIAIIERAELPLGPGLTVFTGETGAGKSLFTDALELALGGRADSDLVRRGAKRASVRVAFAAGAIDEFPEAFRLDRDLTPEGRSICRIDGKSVPVGTLRQVGRRLVDMHGQHDHQALLVPESHLRFLDLWGGEAISDAIASVSERYRTWHAAAEAFRQLERSVDEREERLQTLAYQIQEIESAELEDGELAQIDAQLHRLQHAEKLASATFTALDALADGEHDARTAIATAIAQIQSAERFDTTLGEMVGPLETALSWLDEAVNQLRPYGETLEASPGDADQLVARRDRIKRLMRKYGASEAAIIQHLDAARAEHDLLTHADADLEDRRENVAREFESFRIAADGLSTARRAAAERFSREVERHLADLALERAEFQCEFLPAEPSELGIDAMQFLFCANPGEPLRPLHRVASGGEMSRVMLSIKAALAGAAGVPTLIFDEVDAGIGGRAAAVMGRKLRELSQHRQVIVISHSPQIASQADEHFRIRKHEIIGRVVTEIERLDPESRVVEIARMLAGEDISDSALANARELLRR